MPNAEQILEGLRSAAQQWQIIAMAWHVALAAFLLAMLMGFRPPRSRVALGLATPLLSVALVAWSGGNLFNSIVFGGLALALAVMAVRLPAAPVQRVRGLWCLPAGALILLGWTYPHFLPSGTGAAYLYAAPLGVIPCPTLAAVAGCSLLLGGFGSRAWTAVIVAAVLFYGLFGGIYLGVTLDWILLLGAVSLGLWLPRPCGPAVY
ncbi:MAG: hypothetical protein PVI56_07720 [Gammaproteobacteria bacterium]|jgi:hypothetical protein